MDFKVSVVRFGFTAPSVMCQVLAISPSRPANVRPSNKGRGRIRLWVWNPVGNRQASNVWVRAIRTGFMAVNNFLSVVSPVVKKQRNYRLF